jgi:hypothetical protein
MHAESERVEAIRKQVLRIFMVIMFMKLESIYGA